MRPGVDQSGDQQPAKPAKRDVQGALLKSKTPGQVDYEGYSCHLGVKGSWVRIPPARRVKQQVRGLVGVVLRARRTS